MDITRQTLEVMASSAVSSLNHLLWSSEFKTDEERVVALCNWFKGYKRCFGDHIIEECLTYKSK